MFPVIFLGMYDCIWAVVGCFFSADVVYVKTLIRVITVKIL